MRVAFRADASIDIGTGHVMRCLTLADILADRGAHVHFLSRDEPGHLGELIMRRGHELALLPCRKDLAGDAEDCLLAMAGQKMPDWLVVDHYALDAVWERSLRGFAKKIMVIDDLADRPHDCDLLLDQNLQEPGRYASLVPQACYTLIGPKYALLRPQFAATRQAMCPRNGKVSRLLVFFGGADAGGETLKAIAAIKMLDRPGLAVDVVIGQTNPHRAAIEAACHTLPRATLSCQVDDMAARMAVADLFVGAGGTSSWERCCLGLPALVLATADNQIAQSEALARAGAQLYAGPANTVSAERLQFLLNEIVLDLALLKCVGEQGGGLVDGLGSQRVIQAMETEV